MSALIRIPPCALCGEPWLDLGPTEPDSRAAQARAVVARLRACDSTCNECRRVLDGSARRSAFDARARGRAS